MKLTIEQKALAACRASAAAAKEIARLKQLIGDSLGACHAAWMHLNPGAMWDANGREWKSHLSEAYSFEDEEETQYTSGRRAYLPPELQQEVLAQCPHCLAAHNAIQARKQARKQLANARRAITAIGKAP